MNKTKLIFMTIGVATTLLFVGCSTHPTPLDYGEFVEFDVRSSAPMGEPLGDVSGRHRGAAWESCGYVTRTAVWKMIADAKEMGATAIGDVRWRDGCGPGARCKRRWGYTVFFFPALLTGLFMDAEVSGVAYVGAPPEEASTTPVYVIPKSETAVATLVDEITSHLGS